MTPPSKAHHTPPDLIETMARAMHGGYWEAASETDRHCYYEAARDAIKAVEEAGWVLAPKEPTSEMMTAWWPLIYSQTDAAGFKSGWAQMIAVVQRDRSDT